MIINNTRKHKITIGKVQVGKKKVTYDFAAGKGEENTITQYDYHCLMQNISFERMIESKVLVLIKDNSTKKQSTKKDATDAADVDKLNTLSMKDVKGE